MVAEKEIYEAVRRSLWDCFQGKVNEVYLAITSEGVFPEEIKKHVSKYEEIIFSFLKRKNAPDITGFYKLVANNYAAFYFITVEIKNAVITLEDIYQAKRYADLFKARYGFLISTKPIPTEIERLCEKIQILYIAGTDYQTLKLAQFDAVQQEIIQKSWFPESPFK